MTILQVNNHNDIQGGSEVAFHTTIRLLRKEGYKVFSLSSTRSQLLKTTNNDILLKRRNILREVISFFFNMETVKYLRTNLNKKIDIIHLHNYYGIISSSIIYFALKNKIPCVQTLHDYRLICPISSLLDNNHKLCQACIGGKYFHCIIKRCNKRSVFRSMISALECYYRDLFFNPLKNISIFICVSKFQHQLFTTHFYRYKHKFVNVYNTSKQAGIEINRHPGNYLLFIGRLSREKGLATLLKAMTICQKKILIIGSGDIPIHKKDDNIEFLGKLSSDKIFPILSKCSYLIIPSEWYENNPLVAIEALSCGKPIIGSNIGGLPELITGNGFMFSPGNVEALAKTINYALSIDDTEYQKLHEVALKKYESLFNEKKYIDELVKIYTVICKK